ncbi:uncharacterized protein VTP21DRAFT_11664 [Calcarisporiella thermophila]|uniref:uncharacterized protein n=1 Tax=Calcarisporiella thermophila TaxID=911321 RepID=UPI00374272CB
MHPLAMEQDSMPPPLFAPPSLVDQENLSTFEFPSPAWTDIGMIHDNRTAAAAAAAAAATMGNKKVDEEQPKFDGFELLTPPTQPLLFPPSPSFDNLVLPTSTSPEMMFMLANFMPALEEAQVAPTAPAPAPAHAPAPPTELHKCQQLPVPSGWEFFPLATVPEASLLPSSSHLIPTTAPVTPNLSTPSNTPPPPPPSLSYPSAIPSHVKASAAPARYARRFSAPTTLHPCPHPGCERTFQRAHNLRAHLRSHLTRQPFDCTTCQRTFSRKHDLHRHMRLHTGDRPFVCGACQKGFMRSDALKRHWKQEEACGSSPLNGSLTGKRRHSSVLG